MSEKSFACFDKNSADFLLSITVHKARNLITLNADPLVVAIFNDERKKTQTYQNSDCPFFNEYFVFEIRTTLEELLKKNIRLSVMQASCFLKKNAIIGEVSINLSTVWKQKHHAFLKKWAILEKVGEDKKNATTGYLQIDLTIVSPHQPPTPAALQICDDDIIEKNMLLPNHSNLDQKYVQYLVHIYSGNFIVTRDYILRVTFGPYQTRTRQIKHSKSCIWNEQLIFKDKFESLNQTYVFELLVHEYCEWKVKASAEINFSDMCWAINGICNKPSFGPCYIYFYEGYHKNLFFGKLLISIETEEIDERIVPSKITKQDILMPMNESEYWSEEIFKVNMILVNMDGLNFEEKRMKIYLSCEYNFSNSIELDAIEYDGKMKMKFAQFNSSERPLMSLSVKLPDNRLKLQVKNLVTMLVREMETNIKSFQLFEAFYYDNIDYQSRCIKMLYKDLQEMLKGIKAKLYHKTFKKVTQWDENFMKFVQSATESCLNKIDGFIVQSSVNLISKNAFEEYANIRDSLAQILKNMNGSEPKVYLNITCDGKLLAFHRFEMINYFHSQAFDAKGENCGKFQTILMKPTTCSHTCAKCGCFFGKIDILMWIGSEKEVNEWLPSNTVLTASNKVNFSLECFYNCNAYVHQAKVQPGIEGSGLNDTKLVVIANGFHEKTKVVTQSLSAVWNEVLVIENVKAYDIGDGKLTNYPSIIMLLFDEDKQKINLMGNDWMEVPMKPAEDLRPMTQQILPTKFPEKVNIRKVFHQLVNHSPPHLRWIKFHKDGLLTAEVLMSAEFVHLSTPVITTKEREKNDPLPLEIRPNMGKFRMEIVFDGIRNAVKQPRAGSGRYKVELTMGDLKLSSGFSGKTYKTNMNFIDPYSSGYLLLPDQFHFWPPIIIRYLDCSHKNPNVVATAMIRRPNMFFVDEKPKEMQRFLLNQINETDIEAQVPQEVFEIAESDPLLGVSDKVPGKRKIQHFLSKCKLPPFLRNSMDFTQMDSLSLENVYTWWTKFFNSNREERFKIDCLHQLTIFNTELEQQKQFSYFNDWAYPIDLIRTKDKKHKKFAALKCSIKVSKCAGQEYFASGSKEKFTATFPRLKRNLMVELPVIVRVYVVQGINLRTRDLYGYSDAFIKVEFGDEVISDRAHYVPNQFSPVFGKRFQLPGVIPQSTLLKVSVYDRDTLSYNDLIGTTVIDLEDRVRSKHLANCGLSNEYSSRGYNAWRNSRLPSEILSDACNELELSLPQYFPDHVHLAGFTFSDASQITTDENMKERLALTVLNSFDKIPAIGYSMVPEHVETRSLYREDRPGVEQGKLQMWVEIFDPKKTIPEPVDITPTPARLFELRAIIWNSKKVILDDRNIFGSQMSDIYVKGWLHNVNEAQFTDVHYRSLNGEGNFNWRMVFPLRYSLGEDMMVITKHGAFEKFDTEIKLPAVLNLQIWDNDSFSPDDFLGTASINLAHFNNPSSPIDKCAKSKHNNLFAINGSVRRWITMYGKSEHNGPIKQTGKLEIELELLLDDKAKANPVGRGREGPNKLPTPNRPDTAFKWISNPVRSIKHILWPPIRKIAIFAVIGLILTLIIVILLMHFPNMITSKGVGL